MVVCGRDLGLSAHFLVMVDDALSLRPVGMAVAITNVWPFAAAQQVKVGRGVGKRKTIQITQHSRPSLLQ